MTSNRRIGGGKPATVAANGRAARRAAGGHREDALVPVLYHELRKLARFRLSHERADGRLDTTELVHEVYVRLAQEQRTSWDSEGHYFSAAAEAMRRILVEAARKRMALKRGGGAPSHPKDVHTIPIDRPLEEVLFVDEALDAFADQHPRKAELVKLRYFVGMTHQEAAQALGISRATADRDWRFARAWLHGRLREEEDHGARRSAK